MNHTISPLRPAVSASTVGQWLLGNRMSPIVFFILFYSALVWVSLFCVLQAWTMFSFIRGNIPVIWPLKVLRVVANVSASVAFIPLFSMLLSVFQCGDALSHNVWDEVEYECYTGIHLALSIIAGIAAVLLTVLCGLFSLFFYDSHLLTTNLAGMVHGRIHLLDLITEAILVFTMEIVPRRLGAAALASIMLVLGFLRILAVLVFMPFIHHGMNQWYLGSSFMFVWAVLCLFMGIWYPGYDAAVTMYSGILFTGIAGVAAASARRSCVRDARKPMLWTPFDAELRVRYMIQKAVNDIRFNARARNAAAVALSEINVQAQTNAAGGASSTAAPHGSSTSIVPHSGGDQGMTKSALRLTRQESGGGNASMASIVKKNAPPAALSTPQIEDASWEVSFDRIEASARANIIRKYIPASLKAELEAFYKKAIIAFPQSAILQVFVARFHDVINDNRQLQLGHLLQVTRLNPALDVEFLAYQARRELESHAGSGALSALSRVSLEKYLTDARRCVYRAAHAQLMFWTSLANKSKLASLHKWSKRLTDSSALAETAFQEIFSIDPQSVVGLRSLAEYHLAVSNDPEKAAAITAEADRLEEIRAKEQQGSASISQHFGLTFFKDTTIDVHSDNIAIITIGGQPQNLGIMLSVNSFACRLLGYSRHQMLRQNLNIVLPSPIAELHDSLLRRYLATGEGRFVDMSRTMFVKTRSVPFQFMQTRVRISVCSARLHRYCVQKWNSFARFAFRP